MFTFTFGNAPGLLLYISESPILFHMDCYAIKYRQMLHANAKLKFYVEFNILNWVFISLFIDGAG